MKVVAITIAMVRMARPPITMDATDVASIHLHVVCYVVSMLCVHVDFRHFLEQSAIKCVPQGRGCMLTWVHTQSHQGPPKVSKHCGHKVLLVWHKP